MAKGVTVSAWVPDVTFWDDEFWKQSGAAAVLLPDRLDGASGRAYYQEDSAGIVKAVKHRGGSLAFAFPGDRRDYISEHGAAEVVTHIGFALVDPLTYDVVKWLVIAAAMKAGARLGIGPNEENASAPVSVKIARLPTNRQGGVVAEGIEISGTIEEVERTLRAIVEGGSEHGAGTGGTEDE
ncbi:hypothetical protein ACFVKB_01865 [Rhodococcus sp. NPDC127530]|uniref:hypothetical protein n=1 Tax=unclassified Rhodococcus (in: high G+C Gram-positive bacteria) TaxID=192944 RepID=UPI00362CDB1E